MILDALKKRGIDHIQEGRNLLNTRLAEFGIKPHTRPDEQIAGRLQNTVSPEELYGRLVPECWIFRFARCVAQRDTFKEIRNLDPFT
jgi:hypothetical protein